MEGVIQYSDFKKLDVRVGRVIQAERVEHSEKLLKLQVDVGAEKRQIVAGIAKQYAPEALVGKQIVIAVNLEPRWLMGIESQGMLLAADGQEGPVLLQPEQDVPAGTIIR